MLVARRHDIVITGRGEADTARRFSTQRVTRSTPSPGTFSRSTGARRAIVINIRG